MRSVPQKVRFQVPQGEELARFKKQPNTLYVFVGNPVNKVNGMEGDTIMVQVADRFVALDHLTAYVEKFKSELLPDEQEEMTVMLKIDERVNMRIVTEVKQALRKAGALKVHYSAKLNKSSSKDNL